MSIYDSKYTVKIKSIITADHVPNLQSDKPGDFSKKTLKNLEIN